MSLSRGVPRELQALDRVIYPPKKEIKKGVNVDVEGAESDLPYGGGGEGCNPIFRWHWSPPKETDVIGRTDELE